MSPSTIITFVTTLSIPSVDMYSVFAKIQALQCLFRGPVTKCPGMRCLLDEFHLILEAGYSHEAYSATKDADA